MMAGRHLVREAERGHVIDRRLTRSHHHRDDRRDESGIGGEGLLDPFLGDRARRKIGYPGEAAEGVDRKSVVQGKGVAVRVDLGGRDIIKTTKYKMETSQTK